MNFYSDYAHALLTKSNKVNGYPNVRIGELHPRKAETVMRRISTTSNVKENKLNSYEFINQAMRRLDHAGNQPSHSLRVLGGNRSR